MKRGVNLCRSKDYEEVGAGAEQEETTGRVEAAVQAWKGSG